MNLIENFMTIIQKIRFKLDFSSIKSKMTLNNGLSPVLKAGSSGILMKILTFSKIRSTCQ